MSSSLNSLKTRFAFEILAYSIVDSTKANPYLALSLIWSIFSPREIEIPSAQIKSGLILAALNTEGVSHIIEKNITRDHTENMLKSFGAHINIEKNNNETSIYIKGKQELKSNNINGYLFLSENN